MSISAWPVRLERETLERDPTRSGRCGTCPKNKHKETKMQTWMSNPPFVVYAITTLVLCANLLFLWAYSGAAGGKTKTALNLEDPSTVAKGAKLVEANPP